MPDIDVLSAIFMIAVSPAADGYVHGGAYKALYASILGPFFLTILLMFVSGLTLQERPGAKKRKLLIQVRSLATYCQGLSPQRERDIVSRRRVITRKRGHHCIVESFD